MMKVRFAKAIHVVSYTRHGSNRNLQLLCRHYNVLHGRTKYGSGSKVWTGGNLLLLAQWLLHLLRVLLHCS